MNNRFFSCYSVLHDKVDMTQMNNRYIVVKENLNVNVDKFYKQAREHNIHFKSIKDYQSCATFFSDFCTRGDRYVDILFITSTSLNDERHLSHKDIIACYECSPLVQFFIGLLTNNYMDSTQQEHELKGILKKFFASIFSNAVVPHDAPETIKSIARELQLYFDTKSQASLKLRDSLHFIADSFTKIKEEIKKHLHSFKEIDIKRFSPFLQFAQEDMRDVEEAINDALAILNNKKINESSIPLSELYELPCTYFSFPPLLTKTEAKLQTTKTINWSSPYIDLTKDSTLLYNPSDSNKTDDDKETSTKEDAPTQKKQKTEQASSSFHGEEKVFSTQSASHSLSAPFVFPNTGANTHSPTPMSREAQSRRQTFPTITTTQTFLGKRVTQISPSGMQEPEVLSAQFQQLSSAPAGPLQFFRLSSSQSPFNATPGTTLRRNPNNS